MIQATDAFITIFGGTGFLGTALVKRLLAEGNRVRVAVRDPGKAKANPALKSCC